MFKIGDFSKISRVPVSALRFYADSGLLEPEHINPANGYRYYKLDQLARLHRILALKDLGLSLEQIKVMLDEPISPAELRGMLRIQEAQINQELAEAQARLARVKVRLSQIETEEQLPMQEVILKSVEEQTILTVREVIPAGEMVEQLFLDAYPQVARTELVGTPFSIFHDDELKEQDIDVEICFPVASLNGNTILTESGRELKFRKLEGLTLAACSIHVGEYTSFPQSYEYLGRWISAHRFEIDGPIREIYLRPPGEHEPALTEIQIPVRKSN
jgi:DNA-binding transcriptional MerR regulator